MRRLITLGCSLTEGIGVFDLQNQNEDTNKDMINFGWPSKLGKKLGFDEVINLGLGGSSNSAHSKILMEREDEFNFHKDDKIVVVWLLTSMYRFSFYRQGKIHSFMSDDTPTREYNELFKAYINSSSDIFFDSFLETKYLIKLVEGYCKSKGYEFFFGTWEDREFRLMKKYFKHNPNFICQLISPPNKMEYPNYYSQKCGHPNEVGYELMSDVIFNWIDFNRNDLIERPKDNIDLKWLGITPRHDYDEYI